MRKINKRTRIKFEKLMRAMLLRRVGREQGTIQTQYGPLELRHFEADGGMYSLFTCFQDPSKLPGEQVPYQFATPESNQTFSLGGSIGGIPFNGYSGKWNFHFHKEEDPFHVVRMIEFAFDHLGIQMVPKVEASCYIPTARRTQ